MTKAWERFGKPFKGYDWQDFELLVFSPFPDDQEIKRFFDDFVFGYKNLISKVKSLLPLIGLELIQNFGQDLLLHNWGIRVSPENIITQIHPEAKAYHVLMKNDKIQSYSERSSGTILLLDIERSGRKLTIELTAEEQLFFPDFTLVVSAEKRAFEDWIK
jgi:hypothetical protein